MYERLVRAPYLYICIHIYTSFAPSWDLLVSSWPCVRATDHSLSLSLALFVLYFALASSCRVTGAAVRNRARVSHNSLMKECEKNIYIDICMSVYITHTRDDLGGRDCTIEDNLLQALFTSS